MRLAWRAAEPASLADLRSAWQASVDAFEGYGHRYEGPRSRARLAEVLAAAGDDAAAQVHVRLVREAADRLGSEPLRALVAGPAPQPRAVGTEELTTREREILGLLALGRSNGQIGTVSSSRRVKDDITDMAAASSGLMQLRPVTFHYKSDQNPAGRTLQFGLIAERNVFDSTRRPHRAQPREARQGPVIESVSLVGTLRSEKGTFAFFDGTSAEYRKAVDLDPFMIEAQFNILKTRVFPLVN